MNYADFDEWMSGRYWLGDKAPAEGFYGRYTLIDLAVIRTAWDVGCTGNSIEDNEQLFGDRLEDERYAFLARWARDVGESLTRKMNEKSE
jgi:hypothetical protein